MGNPTTFLVETLSGLTLTVTGVSYIEQAYGGFISFQGETSEEVRGLFNPNNLSVVYPSNAYRPGPVKPETVSKVKTYKLATTDGSEHILPNAYPPRFVSDMIQFGNHEGMIIFMVNSSQVIAYAPV